MGVHNMVVDTKITRGFDYYTGMVFEVFDTTRATRARSSAAAATTISLELFGGDPFPPSALAWAM